MVAKRGTGHVRKFGRGKTWYRLIYVNGKQRLEHRVVMERKIGRRLRRNEIVHHKDGNGLHNDESNLEITTRKRHRRAHMGTRKWPLDAGIDMRRRGATLQMIADRFGVTVGAVRLAFIHRKISTQDRRHGTNKWDVGAALSDYRIGSTLAALARAHGVSAQSIRKAFVKRGVTVNRNRASNRSPS